MTLSRVHRSLAVTAVLLLASAAADAATFTANPIADTFVTTGPSGNLSLSNYGGAGALSVAAVGSTNGQFQSVMRYDLSGAKTLFDATFGAGQWTVQSVTLQLTGQSPNNPIFNGAVAGLLGISWMQNDAWVEGSGTPPSPSTTGITYDSLLNTFINNSLDQNLGTLSYNGATSGSFVTSLTLSSGLRGDIQTGDMLSLRLFAADLAVSGVFPARTFGTASSRPLLTIDAVAVPEPSTWALAVLGLACVCMTRFIRRA
jgi:hypothetical protein